MGVIELDEGDAVVVFKENGAIEFTTPTGDEEEVLPDNVMFAVAVGVLLQHEDGQLVEYIRNSWYKLLEDTDDVST